jgi:hypothetical protein
VEAFNNAQDDDQALADSERHATTNTSCFSMATIILAVVIALALALAVTSANVLTLNIRKVRRATTPDVS